MAIQANPYPLRIDKTIMQKMKIIAAINGRSLNKEIEVQLRNSVAEYEQTHGPIPVSSESE
mgnify:CR=1 FL=1